MLLEMHAREVMLDCMINRASSPICIAPPSKNDPLAVPSRGLSQKDADGQRLLPISLKESSH